ncbi:MAG: hypothetical protein A2408_03100 [Candidatus Yonathbacteria bacterium RIFOXYC1_FULL_52_10]|uniref:histidine kinase n=1 Tax=Candidatus Yonathbacteria bacterium RIFOXYD1_FULL_52_36 TaxID=1802730 RepID=A0A1G2SJY9_9BACT|nr:MAG: hypothetical protein A2408_03100 [Candidatus Yonathbacteria bacterium RIFOXYC1_FULL_52_10]OHA84929.1 MAG: hypothetical protein A2591_01215 [Candidatus Yonathbacteria bacterium RIFOXYD1_FULL_52_36]
MIISWKIIVAPITIITLWVLLSIHIFQSNDVDLLEISIFIVSFFLGGFLFYTAYLESRQRQALQLMADNLRTLNETLESRVSERTEDMFRAKIHTDAIIESLTLGLIEYRGDHTVVRLNRAAEDMLGVKRETITGKQLLPADMSKQELSSLGEVTFFTSTEAFPKQKKGNPYEATIDEVSIDYPTRRDLQVITVLLPTAEAGHGLEHNFIKLVRDVTREKLVEKSKSNFITVAAHQLRTPLSAIRWAINLIISDSSRLTPDQISILQSGAKATEQVVTLINDLLDASQIEEGRFGYEFTSGNLADAIRAATTPFTSKAAEKPVTLEVKVPEENPAVTFDQKKLGMVIQNLLTNALTYTPAQGHVGVTLEYGDRFATVTIADTGVGIPADESMRIFTKFFRSKKALVMETSGSGLGLYIAKNIVERHGGHINLESQENRGTIVSFTVPLHAEDIPEE